MERWLVERLMREALREAERVVFRNEVPVGAVVATVDGEILGKGHNLKESLKDPTSHAEIIAIRQAAQRLGDWRLEGCVLVCTVEPCLMCCGAILQARIDMLFYGARNPKFGAVESVCRALDLEWNHRVLYEGGILEEECVKLLKDFFARLRA